MISLEGAGFVAIWNDVAAAAEEDFDAWHRQEHMPERLAIAGFVSGTRWKVEQPARGYFTLYILEGPEVAVSEAYLARLNDPTPWTRRIMAGFLENSRCVGWFGQSRGGPPAERIIVARCSASDANLGQSFVDAIMGVTGVSGCQLGLSDRAGSALPTTERQGRQVGEPTAMLIASLDPDADAGVVLAAIADVLSGSAFSSPQLFHRELMFPDAR